ncbi:hypothetical protein AVEN_177980-1 [Araneus ventricosus]|uniref:Uncharacterized protein n=1 Tax=Araneus ventricosus TaxID=182803 RepID=A0A4Y2ELP8_ARAVE|nr:hypothetical protein AVEN_177980-1 [Araneus ventricosus]
MLKSLPSGVTTSTWMKSLRKTKWIPLLDMDTVMMGAELPLTDDDTYLLREGRDVAGDAEETPFVEVQLVQPIPDIKENRVHENEEKRRIDICGNFLTFLRRRSITQSFCC